MTIRKEFHITPSNKIEVVCLSCEVNRLKIAEANEEKFFNDPSYRLEKCAGHLGHRLACIIKINI